jgi:hypothetical protein
MYSTASTFGLAIVTLLFGGCSGYLIGYASGRKDGYGNGRRAGLISAHKENAK